MTLGIVSPWWPGCLLGGSANQSSGSVFNRLGGELYAPTRQDQQVIQPLVSSSAVNVINCESYN